MNKKGCGSVHWSYVFLRISWLSFCISSKFCLKGMSAVLGLLGHVSSCRCGMLTLFLFGISLKSHALWAQQSSVCIEPQAHSVSAMGGGWVHCPSASLLLTGRLFCPTGLYLRNTSSKIKLLRFSGNWVLNQARCCCMQSPGQIAQIVHKSPAPMDQKPVFCVFSASNINSLSFFVFPT
jgi:hypothetical protein